LAYSTEKQRLVDPAGAGNHLIRELLISRYGSIVIARTVIILDAAQGHPACSLYTDIELRNFYFIKRNPNITPHF
jgi:hypothetical protein